MRYYYDMIDKNGFGDGDSIPPDAKACRTIYVKTINRYAEAYGSAYRAMAYDRPGMHNWCMIVFVKADQVTGDLSVGRETIPDPTLHSDRGLDMAIEDAHEQELDTFVTVEVRIDPQFGTFLADDSYFRRDDESEVDPP